MWLDKSKQKQVQKTSQTPFGFGGVLDARYLQQKSLVALSSQTPFGFGGVLDSGY